MAAKPHDFNTLRELRPAGRSRLSGIGTAAFSGMMLIAAQAIAAPEGNALGNLPGRWSGWGAIVHDSGKSEQVKCIVTYFVREAGVRIEQNLRCASASYRIDSSAQLTVAGSLVTGRWEERTNSTSGQVSGRVTGTGFNLSIQGDGFTAVMAVSTTACKQSINIAPEGFDIRRIAIGLDKC
ncbi:MAG: hypothetical protein KDJ37_03795 [Hyphomicrobiaceae bacterium]|nr:hypothetical protein [Hyphomicrobiaceae bacterium]